MNDLTRYRLLDGASLPLAAKLVYCYLLNLAGGKNSRFPPVGLWQISDFPLLCVSQPRANTYQPGGKEYAGKTANGRVGGRGLFLFRFDKEGYGTGLHRAPARLFWQQRRDILGKLVRAFASAKNAGFPGGTGCGCAGIDGAGTSSKPQPDAPFLPVASGGPIIGGVAFRRIRLLFSNRAPSVLPALFPACGRLQFLSVLLHPAGSFVGTVAGALASAEEEAYERSHQV